MTAEVFEERVWAYYAYCEECDWDGGPYLDEADAMSEMDWHNETCGNDEEPDTRTEREKFQSNMDVMISALKDQGVIA